MRLRQVLTVHVAHDQIVSGDGGKEGRSSHDVESSTVESSRSSRKGTPL